MAETLGLRNFRWHAFSRSCHITGLAAARPTRRVFLDATQRNSPRAEAVRDHWAPTAGCAAGRTRLPAGGAARRAPKRRRRPTLGRSAVTAAGAYAEDGHGLFARIPASRSPWGRGAISTLREIRVDLSDPAPVKHTPRGWVCPRSASLAVSLPARDLGPHSLHSGPRRGGPSGSVRATTSATADEPLLHTQQYTSVYVCNHAPIVAIDYLLLGSVGHIIAARPPRGLRSGTLIGASACCRRLQPDQPLQDRSNNATRPRSHQAQAELERVCCDENDQVARRQRRGWKTTTKTKEDAADP